MKRRRLAILGGVAALMCGTWALLSSVDAQAPEQPIWIGPESKALFDWNGLDAAGNPEAIKDAECGFTSPIVQDLNAQPTPTLQAPLFSNVVAGPNAVTLATLQASAAEGQYRFWLRLRDVRGNATRWIGGILVGVDRTPPALPTSFRISADGTASIEVEGNDVRIGFAGKVNGR